MGWEIHPDSLRQVLVRVTHDYGPKAVYVTENGAAFPDVVDHEGRVLDPERQQYLEAHVAAAGSSGPGGSAAEGLFRLGSHGQLRVELGVLEALRACVRGLPDPEADTKGQFRLVPRLHRRSASLWPTDGCAEAVATASRPLVSRGCAGGAGLGRDLNSRETSVSVQHQTRPRRR